MNKEQKITLYRIIAAAALLLVAWLMPLEGAVKLILFLVPYFIVGYEVVWEALKNIVHGEIFDEKFLMLIATAGAFLTGEYPEAVAVMLFFEVGELFEDIAVNRSRKSIAALMNIRPDTATLWRDGKEITVKPEEVAIGDIIRVKPGERVPLDGMITEGATSLDTAALTGESLPVDRAVGENVYSGSVNLSGVITVKVQSAYENGTVARILKLTEESAEKKAKVEGFITRFARVYTPCVVGGAVLLAVLPPLFFGGVWADWVSRALIFLVVSCPCALVVSVPLSFFSGIGAASRQGILIKGANDLETLSKTDTVVFDKTGTLTMGAFTVTAIHPQEVGEAELLDIAAVAESFSSHPIAQSILRAHGGHIDKTRVTDVKEIAGQGVEALIDGKRTYVGNGKLMDAVGAKWHECHVPGTAVHIAVGDQYYGHIVISDEIKPGAAEAIAALKSLGVKKTVMLTGDIAAAADAVRAKAGIDEAFSGLLPDQKVGAVEKLLAPGHTVAFVGDGINDAPVLSRVDVGIAMGALGSDAAIEAADVVLMDDQLAKLPRAVRIARKTLAIVRRNIVFALAMKALVLILSALGLTGMWIAVFADVGVLILTILYATLSQRK